MRLHEVPTELEHDKGVIESGIVVARFDLTTLLNN
jgi:hypothetical protein